MDLNQRINSFLELGDKLKNLDNSILQETISEAEIKNSWFTKSNIELSFQGLSNYLNKAMFENWISQYEFKEKPAKKIGLVMAGNIPMVGIHDLICVLLSGHKLIAKLSSQDDVLIPFIVSHLERINPEFSERIEFVDQLKGMDAVIATGSDNTSRYFNYYFSKYPHIIRKNRTSVAVLGGNETKDELQLLAYDMFSYFGLGCRNVSKLFLPDNMDIKEIISNFDAFKQLTDHSKYHNNYYYNKSILLVNQQTHLDSGFALFLENEKLSSPISTIYYEYYSETAQLLEKLKLQESKIQCIVSNLNTIDSKIDFGTAQMPKIWDYADNIDTMKFLLTL